MLRMSFRLALLGLIALLCLPALTYAQAVEGERDSKEVVVEGDPALTKGMIARFTDFFEWIVESPFTVEQREKVRGLTVEAWKTHDEPNIKGVQEILGLEAQVAGLPAEQRDYVRTQVQPDVMKELRADDKEEFSKWLVQIFDTAHVAIAEGAPPLTRQISQAQAEMFAFMLSEAMEKPCTADEQYKKDFETWLIKFYPTLPADKQAQWAQAPVIWASLRVIWAHQDDAGKADLRKQWKEVLAALLPVAADRSELDGLLKDLNGLIKLAESRPLTKEELEQGATDCDKAAAILKKDGGDEATQQAAQLEQSATQLREKASQPLEQPKAQAAPAQPEAPTPAQPETPSPAPTGKKSAADIMAQVQSQHNTFMSIMNMSMQSHYSTFNSINTLGGNPYRYVNGYGNPY